MSSFITIQPCRFVNYPSEETSYGYRAYDDYASVYNNLWKKEDLDLTNIEIVEKIYIEEGSDEIELMFEFIIENELGIFVGDNWLNWDQIKSIL